MTENNPGFQPPAWQGQTAAYGAPTQVPQQPPMQQMPMQQPQGQHPPTQPKRGALSVVTLIVSFFIGYLTLIFGIIALRQNWVNGTRGNGMVWAGIIIGAVLGTVQFFFFYTIVNAFTQGSN